MVKIIVACMICSVFCTNFGMGVYYNRSVEIRKVSSLPIPLMYYFLAGFWMFLLGPTDVQGRTV